MKKAAEEMSPGTVISKPGTAGAGSARNRPSSTRTRSPRAGSEHALGVVPGTYPSADQRRAFGTERREDQGALHLGARHGQIPAEGMQGPASRKEGERRERPPGPRLDAGAHGAERLHHPGHGPARERGVAGHHREEGQAGEHARQEPQGGARVAGVEHPRGLGEPAKAGAADGQGAVRRLVDGDAELPEARPGGHAVAGRERPPHDARPPGHRGEEERPVGDGLVGRRRICASQPRMPGVEGRLHGGESSDGI